MKQFIQRHAASVLNVLSGFDRLRIRGTKRLIANVAGLDRFLRCRHIPFKHFIDYATGITDRICQITELAARVAGRSVRYLESSYIDKEETARQIAREHNIQQGLVCILSCVEPCYTYQVIKNRQTRELDLVVRRGKCKHYYHYYIHPALGFMHIRFQTWFPFNVHVWVNGREWLARQMDAAGLGYQRQENCFIHLDDPEAAQRLMDLQLRTDWTKLLDSLVPLFNPLESQIFSPPLPYYWSVDASEWATDILFRSRQDLAALYPRLIRHAIEHVDSREVMRFLGRKVPVEGRVRRDFHGEVVTDLRDRPEGMRIKHRVNSNWVKMYDKQGVILRVETVINNPRDFRVYRTAEGDPDGPKSWLPLRKGVADLYRRVQVSQAANERYLAGLAEVDATTPLGELIQPLCQPVECKGKRVRALNPLSPDDAKLLQAVNRGEFAINGFRNRDLRALLFKEPTSDAKELRRQSGAITRKIRLLRAHGLIFKVQKTHRYMLTAAGRRAITALLAARAADPAKLTAAA